MTLTLPTLWALELWLLIVRWSYWVFCLWGILTCFLLLIIGGFKFPFIYRLVNLDWVRFLHVFALISSWKSTLTGFSFKVLLTETQFPCVVDSLVHFSVCTTNFLGLNVASWACEISMSSIQKIRDRVVITLISKSGKKILYAYATFTFVFMCGRKYFDFGIFSKSIPPQSTLLKNGAFLAIDLFKCITRNENGVIGLIAL